MQVVDGIGFLHGAKGEEEQRRRECGKQHRDCRMAEDFGGSQAPSGAHQRFPARPRGHDCQNAQSRRHPVDLGAVDSDEGKQRGEGGFQNDLNGQDRENLLLCAASAPPTEGTCQIDGHYEESRFPTGEPKGGKENRSAGHGSLHRNRRGCSQELERAQAGSEITARSPLVF